jgi:segregation and condensation protein B
MELKRILEAVLFSSSRPLAAQKLFKRLEVHPLEEIKKALRDLIDDYRRSESAFEIVEVSGGYQMRTRVEYRDWVKRFAKEKDIELTRSMLETLSIVAYRQPVTKREIDGLRGVDSVRSIKHLLERRLIELAGRNGDSGKMMTFRTTGRFLEVYGLRNIDDLPTYKEMESLER